MTESRRFLEGGDILVATDGSPDAGTALTAAVELCRKTGGSLHLAHVLPDVNVPLSGDPARFEEEGKRLLEEAASRVSGTGVRVEKHLLSGIPFREIVRLSKELEASLIVMGSRGLGLLGRLTLGSVTEAVCHHARSPVLVLRGGEAAWPPERVVVADDGSPAARAAAELAAVIGGLFGAGGLLVRAYHAPAYHTMAQARAEMLAGRAGLPEREESEIRGRISGDAEELAERARRLSEISGEPFETLAEAGEPAYLVVDAASRSGMETSTLVAAGDRGLGALKRMWLGSVSTNLLRATRGPVLLCPAPEEDV